MTYRQVTAASIALLLAIVLAPSALAQEPPDYVVADTAFEALDGATAFDGTLTLDGADSGWQIEVPDDWNGTLVLYAHGFVGPQQAELVVQQPQLRELFIDQGFAWAASSYSANGYVIDDSVEELDALRSDFAALTGLDAPTATIIHGVSMGGHITGVAVERRPDAYVGALPACGVMADVDLFDYFADVNLLGGTLSGVEVGVPETLDFLGGRAQTVSGILGLQTGLRAPIGDQYASLVEGLSGGERPTFEQSLDFWNIGAAVDPGQGPTIPFLQALYGRALSMGIETPAGQSGAYDNTDTTYAFPGSPGADPSVIEALINGGVPRVAGGTATDVPVIEGTPQIPVLSLHNTGDLFVPLFNERTYAAEVAANGLSDNLVQRTVRAAGHCDFTAAELGGAFVDLVTWIGGGDRPAGEDLLDDAVVADRGLGCAFTSETRPGMPPCEDTTATLLEGDSAVTMSLAVSGTWDASDAMVIARDDVYADGLAGTSLAGLLGAPLVLNPSGALDAGVLAEAQRLGVTQAFLLGGPAALAPAVQTALEDAGITVTRLEGPDRFGTAAAIAAAVAEIRGVVGGVYLASARTFADAVAVGGLSAFLGLPVLLTEPTFMPQATSDALAALGDPTVVVIGGPDAVSDDVAGDSARIAGPNRYGTSLATDIVMRGSGIGLNEPWIATDEDFPSALVAGPAAAAAGRRLILVDGDDLLGSADTTEAQLREDAGLIEGLTIVRAGQDVSDATVATLVAAVNG